MRAKNVDTQQVLLHSLFYRIDAHNSRRHLQVLFEKALYNMPNFKYFTIRNVHDQDLRIKLSSPSPDIQLFALNYHPSGPSGQPPAAAPNRCDLDLEHTLGQFIEDLKWGGKPVYHHDAGRRVSSDDMIAIQSSTGRRALSEDKGDSSSVDPPPRLERSPSRQLAEGGGSPGSDAAQTDTTQSVEAQIEAVHRLSYIQCLALMSKLHFPFCALRVPEKLATLADYSDSDTRELHSLASPLKLIDPSCTSPLSPASGAGSDKPDAEEVEGVKIRLIQKCFKKLVSTMPHTDIFYPLSGGSCDGEVMIAVGQELNIGVVFHPSAEGQEQELELTNYLKLIELRLLSVDSEDAERLREQGGLVGLARHTVKEPLKPRQLVMRAKVFRSEMSLEQWSINFGRMDVGDMSTRSATLVNRSEVPCIYSISKSGSISSGFLRISNDHKGYIGPKSSRTIDFIFKPTLSGVFDEVVQINNVLDGRNVQSITVRAKVTKPESFLLLPLGRSRAKTLEGSSSQDFSEQTPPPPYLLRVGSHGSAIAAGLESLSNADKIARLVREALAHEAQRSPIAPVHLGDVLVGEPCRRLVSFKIRNVTAKARTFVVDASHAGALGLAGVTAGREALATGRVRSSSEGVLQESLPPLLCDRSPDAVAAMLLLRCKFEKVSESASSSSAVEFDDRIMLEDKLEHLQQKLKIAQRKNKVDKIAKYEKKVREMESTLLGGGQGSGLVESDWETDTEGADGDPRRADEERFPGRVVGASSSSFSFSIGPQLEASVLVTVTVAPGPGYAPWDGPLPLQGCLRVLEGKNEDVVKMLLFGGLLHCSRGAPLGEDTV